MHTYEVTFTIDATRYHQTVSAETSNDARQLIQSQFPRAVVWDVRRA